MQAEGIQGPEIRLKNANLRQLGQVPFMDYVGAFTRTMQVVLSACFAGWGTDSFAIGVSVFFGLCAIVGAIDRLKD